MAVSEADASGTLHGHLWSHDNGSLIDDWNAACVVSSGYWSCWHIMHCVVFCKATEPRGGAQLEQGRALQAGDERVCRMIYSGSIV